MSHCVSSREQDAAVELVLAERVRQDLKWGGPAFDDAQTQENWVQYINEYANGTDRGAKCGFAEAMTIVSALALAALECEIRKGHPLV